MKAAYVEKFAPQAPLTGLTVGGVGEPATPLGWSTVRIRAAALNGHDLWSLRGVGLSEEDLPRILGSDGAGVDEAGREVLIYPVVSEKPLERVQVIDPRTAPLLSERHDGTLAEHVCVPAHNLFPKPAHLSLEQAAALPTAWLTAYRMLFTLAGVRPGGTVLVQGATGGVSGALIALGAAAGLRMWATSRSERGLRRAIELGAAEAFPVAARLPERVDAVMETVGEATWDHSAKCVRVGGSIVVAGATTGHQPPMDLRRVFFHQIRVIGTRVGTLDEMRGMLALVEHARLEPVIDSVHALEDVADGLAVLEKGDVDGKVVIVP